MGGFNNQNKNNSSTSYLQYEQILEEDSRFLMLPDAHTQNLIDNCERIQAAAGLKSSVVSLGGGGASALAYNNSITSSGNFKPIKLQKNQISFNNNSTQIVAGLSP